MSGSSKPRAAELNDSLKKLVNWEQVAIHLPDVDESMIEKIKKENRNVDDEKLALFSKWLHVCPNATWEDVISALRKADEQNLATEVAQISNKTNKQVAESRVLTDVVLVEEEAVTELESLYMNFIDIAVAVETEFNSLVSLGKVNLSSFVTRLKYEQNVYKIHEIIEVKTTEELFLKVSKCCTFLDCDLLETITENLPGAFDLRKRVRDHKKEVHVFRRTTPIEKLKNKLAPLVAQTRLDSTSLMIVFKLQNVWGQKPIALFETLLETLFPNLSHKMKWYEVEPGSICITFFTHNHISKALISSGMLKRVFMRLVGVFSMKINDFTVLNEDENEKYSFDLAFLEASLTCNLNVLQFLLVVGVNVDYKNEKGKTALILACEQGHKEIVKCLVSAKADVNTSDEKSQSALIFASENNHVELAQILLSAKANPNHQRDDGNTSLHIACYNKYEELAVALIKFGANPLTQNTKGETPLLSSVRSNMLGFLKLILPNLPLPELPSALLLACRLGHSEMISCLLQHIDPLSKHIHTLCTSGDLALVAEQIVQFPADVDSTIVLGITPLMIASSYGHFDIVECLIEAEADVNSTDQEGFSPLAYAITGSKSVSVVECLLQAGANPSIRVGDFAILQLAKQEGQSDLCNLLLQYIALHLYKMFLSLVDKAQRDLSNDIKENKVTLQEIVDRLQKDPEFSHITGITQANSCSEIFNTLKPQYDFLSWKVISFLSGRLEQENYFPLVETFEVAVRLADFKVVTLLPHEDDSSLSSSCSEMSLTLEKQWETKSLFSLRVLNAFLFSSIARVMSHLTVIHSQQKIVVKYRIPRSRKLAETIKSVVSQKRACSSILGIIEIAIDSEPVLSIGQQHAFTFKSAAVNAVLNYSKAMSSDELVKLLKFLFKLGDVDPNIVVDAYTALHHSVFISNLQVVDVLLQNGASLYIGDSDEGITPLIIASSLGHLEIVQTLVNMDPSIVNQTDLKGRTVLMLASYKGHIGIVNLLLQKGSEPNMIDSNGVCALLLASHKGYTEIVHLLLEVGADPNMVDTYDQTALMLASFGGHSEVVKLLLAHHADHSHSMSRRGIPLDSFACACHSGDKETVDVYLNNFNLSPTSLSLGWYAACLYNKPHLIEYLVHSLSQISLDQRELVVACVKGDVVFIKRALPKFSPDVEFVHGVTLLMIACSCGHSNIVKVLIDAGASVHKEDEFGFMAVDYCDKHSPIRRLVGLQQGKETVGKIFNKEDIFQGILPSYSKGVDRFQIPIGDQPSVIDAL